MNPIKLLSIATLTLMVSCTNQEPVEGPYFGNGFRNGWADQNSIVIWTRLTRNPEMNFNGGQWKIPSDSLHRVLANSTDSAAIYAAQLPDSLTLDEMEGACPGAAGEVQLTYFPSGSEEQKQQIDWQPVNPDQDFTKQWKLDDLQPDTEYEVTLLARNGEGVVSDTFKGEFVTAPATETVKPIDFVVVTCHDYWRRDDRQKGHKIYPSMLSRQPDFYVHT
ncbi:MAG: hypothetical protein ACOCXH_14530, partial [Cyclobacteriaceae bacterium]